MRFQTIIISIILILLALTACRDKGTEPYVKSIWLSAEDIGVTDAFIHVILSNDNKPGSFSLKLNGKTILSANARDTLIYSDSLLPKHTYTYKAYRLNGAIVFDSSDALTITTMDTTNHNFTWEIDTLGDGNSSVLYDVAILSDTLAFAVGEIYKKDTTGQFETDCYNLAKWNGQKWELKKIPFIYQGSVWYLPLRCIYAFSENDIWFEAGIHWDGKEYRTIPFNVNFPARVNKSWGTSSNDFYVVGDGGNIAYYNGSSWRKMESGTTIDIKDIWGGMNTKTNQLEIACIASFGAQVTQARKLLLINGNTISELDNSGLPMDLNGIWFMPGMQYYIVGDGIYWKKHLNNILQWKAINNSVTKNYLEAIRGNDVNDIILCGDFGELLHFNGVSWRSYRDYTMIYSGIFRAIAIKGNFVVAVGDTGDRAIIARGHRNQ